MEGKLRYTESEDDYSGVTYPSCLEFVFLNWHLSLALQMKTSKGVNSKLVVTIALADKTNLGYEDC